MAAQPLADLGTKLPLDLVEVDLYLGQGIGGYDARIRTERAMLIARIAARIVSGGSPELRKLAAATNALPHARFLELLSDRLPDVASEELAFRIAMVAGSLAALIVGGFEHKRIGEMTPVTYDGTSAGRGVAYIVGGLTAAPAPGHD